MLRYEYGNFWVSGMGIESLSVMLEYFHTGNEKYEATSFGRRFRVLLSEGGKRIGCHLF